MLSSRFTTFGFLLTRALSLYLSFALSRCSHPLSLSLLLSQPSAHIWAMICFATVVVRERHLAAAAVDNYAMWENLLSVLSIVVYPNRLSLGVCLCECVRHRRIYDYLAPVFHPAPVARLALLTPHSPCNTGHFEALWRGAGWMERGGRLCGLESHLLPQTANAACEWME